MISINPGANISLVFICISKYHCLNCFSSGFNMQESFIGNFTMCEAECKVLPKGAFAGLVAFDPNARHFGRETILG